MIDAGEIREEELTSLSSIFPEIIVQGCESASIDLPVSPSSPLLIRFVPPPTLSEPVANGDGAAAYIERDLHLSHLPALKLKIDLPDGYPSEKPPTAHLATDHDWLPATKLRELEKQIVDLWDDYGRCQIIFAYIDFLQVDAERGFDLDQSPSGCLTLPNTLEQPLINFDKAAKLAIFNAGTYDCGVCLERKSGESCYQLERCGHVFCRQCLHDFFNDAIKEGNVAAVKCLEPSCGKDLPGPRARRTQRPLHPRELLAMGMEEPTVRHYVEMKRKKRLESDKNTIYCPREHCQHPARNAKFPPIPADLNDYPESDSDSESPDAQAPNSSKPSSDSDERLAVCENPKCKLAFCRVCFKSWHGSFERCRPRDPNELSAEDKASYEFIAENTTSCPECASPVEKTEGCNHMTCVQCGGHFCYLCGGWVDPGNPYRHFNSPGTQCDQRLFDAFPDAGPGNADGQDIEAAARAEGDWMFDDEEDGENEMPEGEEARLQRHRNEPREPLQEIQVLGPGPQENQALDNAPRAAAPGREALLADVLPQAERPRARGRGNPFVPGRANGAAAAVRAHENAGRR